MREYIVDYSERVRRDIDELTQWASGLHTPGFATRYINSIIDEIATLSFRADMVSPSQYGMPKMYHPDAKTITVGRRKLTAIFHTEGEYVIVDKLIPSSMIIY